MKWDFRFNVFFMPTFDRLPQVSFRYHCQLYSEWRKTNQRVCLLIPEAKEANFSQHSLLSNELLKKSSTENIV